MTYERCPARLRADGFGRYCSRSTASSTRWRVSSRTFDSRLSTRETVFIDTPAATATSSIRVRMALALLPWTPRARARADGGLCHRHVPFARRTRAIACVVPAERGQAAGGQGGAE